ncbi:MAG: nitroreductase [Pseudomonadota bacterium]
MNDRLSNPLGILLNRRSVVAKNLTEPGPDDDELTSLLATGIRVPDHGKIGPWRLQVMRKPVQARLGDILAARFRALHDDASDHQIEFERQRPQRAPILIVVSSRVDRARQVPEIEQLMSCGAVCQNLLNASVILGYAAQWLTEWPAFDEEIKAALGVPDDQHLVGFIYIGSAAEPPNERPRPGLEDVVSYPETLP